MENYPNFYSNSLYQYPAYTPQNTYTGRYAQPQQNVFPPQINTTQGIPALGKIVDSVEAVKAADIPMDGKTYFFPKADGKEIYGKKWMDDGTTRILKFSLDEREETKAEEVKSVSAAKDAADKLMSRFDDIDGKLERLERSLKSFKISSSRARKEDDKE